MKCPVCGQTGCSSNVECRRNLERAGKPFFSTRIDARGPAGNVFAVIGTAARLLRQLGRDSDADALAEKAMSAQSYDEALAAVREWFPVDAD